MRTIYTHFIYHPRTNRTTYKTVMTYDYLFLSTAVHFTPSVTYRNFARRKTAHLIDTSWSLLHTISVSTNVNIRRRRSGGSYRV